MEDRIAAVQGAFGGYTAGNTINLSGTRFDTPNSNPGLLLRNTRIGAFAKFEAA